MASDRRRVDASQAGYLLAGTTCAIIIFLSWAGIVASEVKYLAGVLLVGIAIAIGNRRYRSRGRRGPTRRSTGRVIGFGILLVVLLLGVFAAATLRIATIDVRGEVEARVRSSAVASAAALGNEIRGLGELLHSYARRPQLVKDLLLPPGPDRSAAVRLHLEELRAGHLGVATAFIADPDGTLVEIVPPTPEIVGVNFAERDWYRGSRVTKGPFLSEAYRSRAAGAPFVVAVAERVLEPRSDRELGIIVAAYGLDALRGFVDDFAETQGVALQVSDRRGMIIATPGKPITALRSDAENPAVAAARAGRTGVVSTNDSLIGYSPIRQLGWTVVASVPRARALAVIGKLRSTILTTAAIVALALVGALLFLGRVMRELDTARSRSAALVAAVASGVVIVDGNLNVLGANRAFEELIGRSESDVIGLPYMEAFPLETSIGMPVPVEDRPLVAAITRNETVETHGFDLFYRRDDGSAVPVRLAASPVVVDGELVGGVAVVTDLTRELEVDQIKSSLVSTASHELRTPLTMIKGFAELLLGRELDEQSSRQALEQINSSAERLGRLIDQLLTVSRLESGRVVLERIPVALASVIRDVVGTFPADASRIAVRVPEDLVILGDRDMLVQILTNLVSNALKYSAEREPVTISARQNGRTARITVEDRGIGMTQSELTQLFEKFYRSSSPAVRRTGGTGLGLYITKNLVQMQGGTIGASSEPDSGTTFTLTFAAAHEWNVQEGVATG